MNGNPRERILREAARARLMARPAHALTSSVDHERGVFMISVAAELAEMHPQTLRMYEARGLIEPKRSPKGTRLYSHADVERLRRIQELTSDGGHEPRRRREGVRARGGARADAAQGRRCSSARAEELQAEIARLEEVKRSVKAELVRYEARLDRPRAGAGPAPPLGSSGAGDHCPARGSHGRR